MPLKYPAAWKFEGFSHSMPDEAHADFFGLIETIAEGTNSPQIVYEDFKSGFGVDSVSTSTSWAITDLSGAMRQATENAARYVASFYAGMESVKHRGIDVPSLAKLNGILSKWDVPLIIDPPNLLLRSGDVVVSNSDVPEQSATPAYVRGRELGRGGFGVVYLVTRKTTVGEYEFAMKVLNPHVFVENKERALSRFKREMKVLEKLQQRGIVSFLEAGVDTEQKPYILMPYIDGTDIQRALAGVRPEKVLRTFDEILLSLEFAHSKGIVHRDLKPTNVLMRSSDDQPIVLDFGCAYMIDQVDESLTTSMLGTSAYIPPEVHRNPKIRSPKQDVFACATLLYQVIVGRLPAHDDYEPIESEVEGYDGIDEVVRAAISSEKRRTESAEIMRQQLREVGRKSFATRRI